MMVVVALLVLATVCAAVDIPPEYYLVGTDVTMNTYSVLAFTNHEPQTFQTCLDWFEEVPNAVTLTFTPDNVCTRYYIRPCQTGPLVPAEGVIVLEKKAAFNVTSKYETVSNATCMSYVNGNEIDSYVGQIEVKHQEPDDRNAYNKFEQDCKAYCKGIPDCQSYSMNTQYDQGGQSASVTCSAWSDSIYSGVGSSLVLEPCQDRTLTYGIVKDTVSLFNCGVFPRYE